MAKKVITSGYDPSTRQWMPVYDEDAHSKLDNLSGNFTVHTANTSAHITDDERAAWNAKVDEADLAEYETTAHANSTYQPKGDYLSANALNDYYTKTETSGADELSAEFEKYQTILSDEQLAAIEKVKSLYNTTVTSTNSSVNVSSTTDASGNVKYDLSVKKDTLVGDDNLTTAYYDETTNTWHIDGIGHDYATTADILASANAITAWVDNQQYLKSEDVSEFITSDDLTNSGYLTKASADGYYQPIGDYLTTADESKFQPAGDYVTTADFDDYKTSVADDIAKGVAASAWIDDFTPTSPLTAGNFISIENDVVSVTGLDTIINGMSGVSAEWNTETSAWDIVLDKEEIAYARYTTNSVAAATEATDVTITGLQKAELYGDKITSNTDSITLQPGLYHADVKLMLQVTTPSPKYEAVKLVAGFSPERSTEIDLDCSYAHNESVCLSFDAMVSKESDVDLSIENLPAGVGYTLSYFNIHEIVNVAGLLTSSQTDIVAGDGLSKDGNELAVKLGGGLKFDNNKNITIAVGNGLKISQSELTTDLELVLDDIAEETVQQVQKLANDLDEKVTTTYDYAGITGYSDAANFGNAPKSGVLTRYLFSVPIKNVIYVLGKNAEDAGKVTTVGVYSFEQGFTSNYVIFGIYEYDPEYRYEDGRIGRTVALCDTGPVKLHGGFNEFPMKHFNKWNETTPEFKSSCIYYAAIFTQAQTGSGIFLATCPGYDATFNANPQLTCCQENLAGTKEGINYNMDENPDLSLSDMGWGTGAYNEVPATPRIFMQFRNKKIVE